MGWAALTRNKILAVAFALFMVLSLAGIMGAQLGLFSPTDGDRTADGGNTTDLANQNASDQRTQSLTMNCSTPADRQAAYGSRYPSNPRNTSQTDFLAHNSEAPQDNGTSPTKREYLRTVNGTTLPTKPWRAVPVATRETCRLIQESALPTWITEMAAKAGATEPNVPTRMPSASREAYTNTTREARAQLALARNLRAILTKAPRSRRGATFDAAARALAARRTLTTAGRQNTSATSQLATQQAKLRGARALLTSADTDHGGKSGALARTTRLIEPAIKVQTARSKTGTQPRKPTAVELPKPTMHEHDSPSAAAFAILSAHTVEVTPEQAADIRALDELPEHIRRALTDVLDAYLGYYRTTQMAAGTNALRVRTAQLQLHEATTGLETALETTDVPESAAQSSTAQEDPQVNISGVMLINFERNDNTYEEDFRLQIDAGGDDTYNNNAGGANASGNSTDAAALIDLEGTDTYNGRNGGGRYVVTSSSPSVPNRRITFPKKGEAAGFLLDAGTGDDTYNGAVDGSNGGGQRAVGFLMDAGGTDTYNGSGRGTNGAGSRNGTGFLLDAGSGGDTYTAAGKGSSNGGAWGGRGFLFDEAGDDTYYGSNGEAKRTVAQSVIDRYRLCRIYPGGGNNRDRVCRVILSIPNPRRVPESGGFLLDGGGTDNYEGPNGAAGHYGSGFLLDAGSGDDTYDGEGRGRFQRGAANGGAFRQKSAGFLLDLGGNDTYEAGIGAQNGGSDGSGYGFLIDGGTGDDTYTAGSKGTNGGGFAGGRGLLVDRGGNDSYNAGSSGTNGGAWKGKSKGFLLDLGGNDTYSAKEGGVNGGAGGGRTLGLLYDNAGTDFYRDYLQRCRDCSDIPRGTVGAQIDRGSGPGSDESKGGSTEVLVVDDTAGAGTPDCPDASYQAIQQAVNDAEYGDTVRVCAGTYPGDVTLNTTNVTLRATNPGRVVLDGAHTRRFGVALIAGKTTVTGFTARNFASTAFLAHGPQSTVSNNVISASRSGVIATGMYTNSLLAETPVSEEEKSTVISNNEVTNTTSGIRVVDTGNVRVSGNTLRANKRGIFLRRVRDVTVHKNLVSGQAVPTASEQRGITSLRSSEITITDNTVTGFTAPADRTRPSGDIATGFGIEIRTPRGQGETATHTLRNNTMVNNTYNLHVTSGRRGTYQHMDIDPTNTVNSEPVLYLVGATNLVIGSPESGGQPIDTPAEAATNRSNLPPINALESPGYVACVRCTNVTVRNLKLAHNGQGVLIVRSKGTHVANVTVHDTLQAISVQGSPSNTVVKNSRIQESFQGIVVRHNCANRKDVKVTSPLGPVFGENKETCVTPSVVVGHNTIRNTGLSVKQHGRVKKRGQGIRVDGAGVTVRRNTISDGYGTGIAMRGSLVAMSQRSSETDTHETTDVIANSTVIDNAISNFAVGVSVSWSSGTTVIGNTITDPRLGLTTAGINSALYRDNIVTNATTGMFIDWSVDGVTARNNSFREVRWGLDVQFLYGGVSKSNDFGTSNTVNGERIIWLNGATGRTIDASDANMVVCIDCIDVTVQDMTITDNAHGVVLFDSTASSVRNVVVEDTLRTGVLIRGGQNNTVRDSTIIDSTLPIWALPSVEKARGLQHEGGRFLPTGLPQGDQLPRKALGSVRIINNHVTIDDASWTPAQHPYGPGRAVRPDLWGHFGIALFDPTAATVSGNTVNGSRWGILQTGRASTLRIENNVITHPQQRVGIGRFGSNPHMGGRLAQMLGIRVTGSATDLGNGNIVVNNNTLTAGTSPIANQNNMFGITIKGREVPSTKVVDNRVNGYQQSLRVAIKSNNSTVSIRRNRLNGAKSASVFISGPTPGDSVVIHQNLLNPLRFGYGVKSSTRGGPGGHMGGGGAGVVHGQPVNATCNRWGAPTGPSSRRKTLVDPVTGEAADGKGSAVSQGHMRGKSNVHFHPWLGESPQRSCEAAVVGTATPTPIPSATRTPWPKLEGETGREPGPGSGDGPGSGTGDGPGSAKGTTDGGGTGKSTVTAMRGVTSTRTNTPPSTATPEIVPGFRVGVGVASLLLLVAVLAVRHRD